MYYPKRLSQHISVRFRSIVLVGFFIAGLGSAFTVTNIQGQSPKALGASRVSKDVLARFSSEKAEMGQFVLLRPSQIAEQSLSGGDPCSTAVDIAFEEHLNGQLESTDCQLEDGSYADFYTFFGVAGERATIDLGSLAFEPFLGLSNESGSFVVFAGSHLTVNLPETGTYIILANSLLPDQFGPYTIRLLGGPNCTFIYTPSSADVPEQGGTFSFDVETQSRCYWQAIPSAPELIVSGTALGNGTVTYAVPPNTTNLEKAWSIRLRETYFHIRQAPTVSCTYALDPASINLSPSATRRSFRVIAAPGCNWRADGASDFISVNWIGNGNGIVFFDVENNNGADRTGSIVVGDDRTSVSFIVNQTGRNCTYSISPTELNVPAHGAYGNYVVDTQFGCTWSLDQNNVWIELQSQNGTGPATRPYHIQPQNEHLPRTGLIDISWRANSTTQSIRTWVNQAARLWPTVSDFDGDGRSDISVFRPSSGTWYLQRSTEGLKAQNFGLTEDRLVPADYTGDGITDVAVYRPSTGVWYITKSYSGIVTYTAFGTAEDLPVPADYDGDGKADIAVFRPSTGTWYIANSLRNDITVYQFGSNGDRPTVGDFDGDGKADIAVFRPSTGAWYQVNSSDGTFFGEQFGISTDRIVPADYDGDTRTDMAIYRPSDGLWYIKYSGTSAYTPYIFGIAEDIPVPGDFDGDGKADIGVFRPSDGTWYIVNSSNGSYTIYQFGQSGDKPTQSAFEN